MPLKRRKNFKDMNISNLGVQEMNAQEIRSTDGGFEWGTYFGMQAVGKAMLGFLAGLGDGIREGMNEE